MDRCDAQKLVELGLNVLESGDSKVAANIFHRAIPQLKLSPAKNEGQDTPRMLSQAYSALGLALSNLGKKEDALGCQELALSLREKAFGEKSSRTALSLANVGMACKDLGDYDGAMSALNHALEIYQELERADDTAKMITSIGSVFFDRGQDREDRGQYLEAIRHHKMALALALDRRTIVWILVNIAECWSRLEQHDEAMHAYLQAHAHLMGPQPASV